MTGPAAVVDPDRRASWPEPLDTFVDRWDREVASSEFTPDLDLPDDAEHDLAAALDGSRLRARHCTRLLAHEVDQVRREGLRVFSAQLFEERLDRAHELGHLSSEEHQRLKVGHLGVAEPTRARGRWGFVHLTVGEAVLDSTASVELLLGRWGGEGIYFSVAGEADRAVLRTLGRPTLVVCALQLDATSLSALSFHRLAQVFLGAARGLADATADLIVTRTVTAAEIESLAHPGDEPYDAHPDLPRT